MLPEEVATDLVRLRYLLHSPGHLAKCSRYFTVAMHGFDYVVHTAEPKQVDTAEYSPMESVKTNIDMWLTVDGLRRMVYDPAL